MDPIVSVIIPTYNGGATLKLAVDSVLLQTYKNLEIIIIDDGSGPKTKEIIAGIIKKDQRVVLLANKTNLGFVKTLNKGVLAAKGKYIARLDDDDCWIDNKKIEKQVNFLEENKDYVLVGGGVVKVGGSGEEFIRYLLPEGDEQIRKIILINNAFAHSSVVFLKDKFLQVKGYSEEFGFFADKELWIKLGKTGKFYNFPGYFISYLDKELDNKKYNARDVQIRRKLFLNLKLRFKYRRDYPGFWKSSILSFFSYIYSFLPYKKVFWPFIYKMRVLMFGQPSYKYFDKTDKSFSDLQFNENLFKKNIVDFKQHEKINKAFEFAKKAHGLQKRDEGVPYIIHPVRVANTLIDLGVKDDDMIVASLLHDTLEDTQTSYQDIEKLFGKRAADLVVLLTRDKEKETKEQALKKVGKDPQAAIVKACDLLDNARSLSLRTDRQERWQRHLWEAKELNIPFIESLNNKRLLKEYKKAYEIVRSL